jgi:hypothetical protein
MRFKYIIIRAENLEYYCEHESLDEIKKVAKDLAVQIPNKEFYVFQYLGSYKQEAVWTPASPELVDHGDEASVPKNDKSFKFYIDDTAEEVVDRLVARKLAGAETKPLKKDE